jgi:hypothetical protein
MADITDANATPVTFTTYGHSFDVPRRYAEGQPLSATEALALDRLRGEMISHKVRAFLSEHKADDGSIPEDKVAEARDLAQREADAYEFSAGRTGGGGSRAPRDPVEKEALSIARGLVDEKLKSTGRKVAKKDAETLAENEVSRDAYNAAVEQTASNEAVRKEAMKIVKQRQRQGEAVAVEI